MKDLRFETIEQLVEYISENNIDITTLTITENIIPETVKIQFDSFSNNSLHEAVVADDNILLVDDYSILENSCGTTKIQMDGKNIWMNVCNMDGVSKAMLDVTINENKLTNIPFILKKKPKENNELISVNKDLLKS